jgi:hypothetical protein
MLEIIEKEKIINTKILTLNNDFEIDDKYDEAIN